MKLVELLADKIAQWPEGADYSVQDYDGCFKFGAGKNPRYPDSNGIWMREEDIEHETYNGFCSSTKTSDYKTAIVTRAQWQAERDRQRGGDWKRHRGGKCPVKAGTEVSTKHRDGKVVDVHHHTAQTGSSVASLNGIWKHNGDSFDIMQYKIVSQPQAEEVEVNTFLGKDVQVEYAFGAPETDMSKLDWRALGTCNLDSIEFPTQGEVIHGPISMGGTVIAPAHPKYVGPFSSEPEGEPVTEIEWEIQFPSGVLNLKAKTDQIDGPLAWRDQITELNAYIEKFTRERDELIERLASEGLALIPAVFSIDSEFAGVQHTIPREEWTDGDIVRCVAIGISCADLTPSKEYTVVTRNGYEGVIDDVGDHMSSCIYSGELEFIRRP